ncbi:uncharacterized protein LOC113334230 isoform X2 [Papaver somniferum]|uniref:uncharacterized protein LOC113334230 isoform X2 n=1 Tax=Papaver somniferum TaxID=3469 RepID=UPI000E70328D|nr:uncharacterized protein LOC113334230 isoform X2 [Papaver somniferum]
MSSTPSSKDISSIQTDAGIQDRVCIQENTSIPIGQPQDQGDQLADDNDLSTETTLVEKMQMFKNLALRPNAKEKRVKWVDESNIATTPETAGFVTQQGPRETGGKDKAVDQKIKEQLDKIRASYATDEQKVELEKKKSVESRKGGKAPLQA